VCVCVCVCVCVDYFHYLIDGNVDRVQLSGRVI
jgi:hypothetical protein